MFSTSLIELESGEVINALPCPFCAAVDLSITVHTLVTNNDGTTGIEEVETGYSVVCLTCQAEGPVNGNEAQAVTDWNTRYFYQDSDDAPWQLESE